jgi:hypothetical protein
MSERNNIKFTKEEMEILTSMREEYAKRISEFGQIYLEKIQLQQKADELMKIEKELQKKYTDLQDKEQQFLKDITEKYGEGSLNATTGEFSPQK